MAEAQSSPEKARRFLCPGCSASLVYEPLDGSLTCPYCGRKEVIPQSAEEIQEQSYEAYLQTAATRMGRLAANALEVQCTACSATVTFTPPEVAGECPFCGTPLVAQAKAADPLVAPDAALPFQITQKQADAAIQ